METKTMAELVASCKFDYVNSNIEANFPLQEVRGKVKIFHFNRAISSEDAIKEMEKEGYVPANATELFHYAKDRWDSETFVVALGQDWRLPDGNRYVVYLDRDGGERCAYLYWTDLDWRVHCRFAAIKSGSKQEKSVESLETRLLDLEKRIAKIENLFNPEIL